jgi:hypothetical protein
MKIKASFWLATALFAGSAAAQVGTLESNYGVRRASPVAVPVYMPGQSASVNAGPSSASTRSDSTASATSSSRGGAAQGVGSQGQSIDSHATYEAQARNPVSTAVGPALTSTNDTCMGSTSLGASAVSFGVSFGSTWTDNNCLMLKNSREMWNMGFKGAALARLCMDELNRESLEATGINCPGGRRNIRASWRNGTNTSDSGYRN